MATFILTTDNIACGVKWWPGNNTVGSETCTSAVNPDRTIIVNAAYPNPTGFETIGAEGISTVDGKTIKSAP